MAYKSIYNNFEQYPLLPTQIVNNAYSDSELTEIEQRAKKNHIKIIEGKQSTRTFFDLHKDPVLYQLIGSKLPDIIKDCFVADIALILEGHFPFEVHTDSGHMKLEGKKYAPLSQVIIPFDTLDAHTITFNQTYLGLKMEEYMYEQKEPIKNHISDSDWKEHLSHVPDWERKFLSIETIFKWNRGDLFTYDMRRLHSASNHRAKGLDIKRGIVLMCKTLEENFPR